MSAAQERARVVLITGAVREPIEFLATLERAANLVRQGTATHIIVSTWKNELRPHPELQRVIRSMGVHLIELDVPVPIGFGAANAQYRTVAQGLMACPPGASVLRVRSDKTLKMMAAMEALLPAPVPAEAAGRFHSPFREKIVTLGFSPTAFLWFSDFCYIGLREDLLIALGVDRLLDDLYQTTEFSPELRVFSTPFHGPSLFLRELFYRTGQYPLSHALAVWGAQGAASMLPLPRAAARLLALHAAIHATSFVTMQELLDRRPQPAGLRMAQFLGGTIPPYSVRTWSGGFAGARCSSSAAFGRMLTDPGLPAGAGPHFAEAQADILAGTWREWALPEDDERALLRFLEAMLRLEPPASAALGRVREGHGLGRAQAIAPPAIPAAAGATDGIVRQQVQALLAKSGVTRADRRFLPIATEFRMRPNLISGSFEASILFWCGIALLTGDSANPPQLADAWKLVSAASRARIADAQVLQGWLLLHREALKLPLADPATTMQTGLAELRDASRLNAFWPAMVLYAAFVLRGDHVEKDVSRVVSLLDLARQAAPAAYQPPLARMLAQLRDHPAAEPGINDVLRDLFPDALVLLQRIMTTTRAPAPIMADLPRLALTSPFADAAQ